MMRYLFEAKRIQLSANPALAKDLQVQDLRSQGSLLAFSNGHFFTAACGNYVGTNNWASSGDQNLSQTQNKQIQEKPRVSSVQNIIRKFHDRYLHSNRHLTGNAYSRGTREYESRRNVDQDNDIEESPRDSANTAQLFTTLTRPSKLLRP
ncbi:hypothetical protein [Glycomyces artemisiae]|uniref:hypothetical protein n=1 Tax=Glycomyces artemisiae TaxID=1076443 RepID=UPI0011B24B64|nr:hypothetical protein [Glycomyces artemisiae]